MAAIKNKQQLVVVDDAEDMRDLISAYFRTRDFEVICFNDAESALKEAEISGLDWDVLLTDYHFTNMNGVEFTVQMKKMIPDLPIIMITASDSTETAVEAIKVGAYDFITKPIHFAQLKTSVDRALHLKDLHGDMAELRERVRSGAPHQSKIIGRSPKFLKALDVARRVANSSATILITGESGTGKEVVTRFIHNESKYKKGPFIAINCSALPENLLESELFGHAKGAFTGAQDKKIGLFEEAQDGTLFLDEIGDLSPSLQAKLLRVLQEKKIRRVGENSDRNINCRIISATHKDLSHEVVEGRFREDLFFRLNVIPIAIPPLRERHEDLIPLAESFLKKYAMENSSPAKTFSKETIKFILDNPWRGNVRELENAVERAVVLCNGPEIALENFTPVMPQLHHHHQAAEKVSADMSNKNTFTVHFTDHLPNLNEVIHRYIEFAVERNGGARDKTAREIGIDRKTLYKRIKSEESYSHSQPTVQ